MLLSFFSTSIKKLHFPAFSNTFVVWVHSPALWWRKLSARCQSIHSLAHIPLVLYPLFSPEESCKWKKLWAVIALVLNWGGVAKGEASEMGIVSSELANPGWADILLVRNVIYAHGASQIHRRNLVRAAVCHCDFFHHHRCSEVSGGIIWCATPGTREMEENKWLGVWSAWGAVGILKLSQLITECNLWQCRTDSWDRADLINYGGDIFLFPLIFCPLKTLITRLHLARCIQTKTEQFFFCLRRLHKTYNLPTLYRNRHHKESPTFCDFWSLKTMETLALLRNQGLGCLNFLL